MKNIEIKIENGEATLVFDGLLSQSDYDQFWKGIDPDNNDGSDGEMTETLQKIFDIYNPCVLEGRNSDFQVWGPDPSFAMHIDPAKVPAMVAELKEAFGEIEVDYSEK